MCIKHVHATFLSVIIIVVCGLFLTLIQIEITFKDGVINANVKIADCKTLKCFASNSTTSNPLGSRKWKALEECQAVRIRRMKTLCQQYNLAADFTSEVSRNKTQLLGVTLKNDKYKIILSAIKKTGCSSWKYVFLHNLNALNKNWSDIDTRNHFMMCYKLGLCELHKSNLSDIKYSVKNYFKIITVRHPLTRLESAFKDKILDLDISMDNITIDSTTTKVFQDFIQQIESYQNNRHFMSYIRNSNPCVIPFDYIAKLETADVEMEYIARKHLSGAYQYTHRHPTAIMRGETILQKDGSKLLSLFSSLDDPEGAIRSVLKHYELDMKLFGYGYRVTPDGSVVAFCDNLSFNGMCC